MSTTPRAAIGLAPAGERIPAVDDLVAELAAATIGQTCNFYREDQSDEWAPVRRERLRRYLVARWSAPIILVGEAPGYRGARLSGIAFTSVAQLGVGPTSEASATIVHRVLATLGLEDDVLLWNTVPTHPHLPDVPDSNRTPSPQEIAAGAAFLDAVCVGRTVVAVGEIAATATRAPKVRHPARGGASAFAAGLAAIADQLGLSGRHPEGGTQLCLTV